MNTKVFHASAIELFVDAAGRVKLGWVAWLPHLGLWMYDQWEEDFFKNFQPSIDFLELYALPAGIVTLSLNGSCHTFLVRQHPHSVCTWK